MGVLEIMKQNQVKPSLIIYTNIIQACFKAKRLDFLVSILQEVDNDGVKGIII